MQKYVAGNFKSALKYAKRARRLQPSLEALPEMLTVFKILRTATQPITSTPSDDAVSAIPAPQRRRTTTKFSKLRVVRKSFKAVEEEEGNTGAEGGEEGRNVEVRTSEKIKARKLGKMSSVGKVLKRSRGKNEGLRGRKVVEKELENVGKKRGLESGGGGGSGGGLIEGLMSRSGRKEGRSGGVEVVERMRAKRVKVVEEEMMTLEEMQRLAMKKVSEEKMKLKGKEEEKEKGKDKKEMEKNREKKKGMEKEKVKQKVKEKEKDVENETLKEKENDKEIENEKLKEKEIEQEKEKEEEEEEEEDREKEKQKLNEKERKIGRGKVKEREKRERKGVSNEKKYGNCGKEGF